MPPFGFGPSGTPWLPQPADWGVRTVQTQQGDPNSTLSFYRAALAARRSHPALGDGKMTWIDASNDVLAFARGTDFACAINYGDEQAELPPEIAAFEPFLLSTQSPAGALAPASAGWYRRRD